MKITHVFLASLLALTANAKTLYVSASRPNNTGAGTSWASAKKTIQAAVNLAKNGDTILVNDGTYDSFTTANKSITIKSVNGASKTVLDDSRQYPFSNYIANLATTSKAYYDLTYRTSDGKAHWNNYLWVLKNGKLVEPSSGKNVKSTVYTGTSTKLVGFMFAANTGAATGFAVIGGTLQQCVFRGWPSPDFMGVAALSTLVNCTIDEYMTTYWATCFLGTKLTGCTCNVSLMDSISKDSSFTDCRLFGDYPVHGSYIDQCISKSSFTRCTLEDGGWLLTEGASTFSGTVFSGGGLYSGDAPKVSNSLFNGCELDGWFGSMLNCTFAKTKMNSLYGDEIQNCIFYKNLGSYRDDWSGEMVYDHEEPPELYADSVDYCAGSFTIGDGTRASHNLKDIDPRFVDAANNDFRLGSNSPCRNAGGAVSGVGSLDLAGNGRVFEGCIDIGAYEWFSGKPSGEIKGVPVVYSPSDSKWYVRGCNPGDYAVFSDPSCVPAPADYDGDGRTDLAVYYPADGSWYIWQSSTDTMVRKQYGWSATCPLPADYDGDGRADLCVYDKPKGDWYFTYSSSNQQIRKNFGWNGCIPVQGDFDGDGRADLAVYCIAKGAYEGHWFIASSADGGRVTEKAWGWSGTVPAPADYDGDGRTDICVFHRPDGMWYILYSGGGSRTIQYGWSTVTPVPADYDGDGRDDVALYDEANGNWFINYSRDNRNVTFSHGWKGAVPVLPQTTVYRWFGM